MAQRIGGSFAPPLDADTLATYRKAGESASPAVAEAIGELADMVFLFQQSPASSQAGTPHPSGRGMVVPLEEAEVERIWDAVPWPHEIDGLRRLFDAIPAEQTDLRDAAFHLLWFAVELSRDREPMTSDRL